MKFDAFMENIRNVASSDDNIMVSSRIHDSCVIVTADSLFSLTPTGDVTGPIDKDEIKSCIEDNLVCCMMRLTNLDIDTVTDAIKTTKHFNIFSSTDSKFSLENVERFINHCSNKYGVGCYVFKCVVAIKLPEGDVLEDAFDNNYKLINSDSITIGGTVSLWFEYGENHFTFSDFIKKEVAC